MKRIAILTALLATLAACEKGVGNSPEGMIPLGIGVLLAI